MLASMTGFSRFDRKEKGCTVVVEMRSLNSRFLDIYVKLPRRFSEFEDIIRNCVQEAVSRGKIDVTVVIEGLTESVQDVSVNLSLAKKYFEGFKKLEKTFNLPFTVSPESLLSIENIFEYTISEKRLAGVKKLVVATLKGALRELKKHKLDEGRTLVLDFRERLNVIARSLHIIRKLFQSRHKKDFKLLRERIERVLRDMENIDPRRLELEAALMAEKFDISEECVRMESHLKMFRDSLTANGAVGRRLDFILQEINREANTIGTKSNNVLISQEVVKIKEEIDRLKEQVRNIE